MGTSSVSTRSNSLGISQIWEPTTAKRFITNEDRLDPYKSQRRNCSPLMYSSAVILSQGVLPLGGAGVEQKGGVGK